MSCRCFVDTHHNPSICFPILSGLQLPELLSVSIIEPDHKSDTLRFSVKTLQDEKEKLRKLLCPPHVSKWNLIMNINNNSKEPELTFIFNKESQKTFKLLCEKIMNLYANNPGDLGNLLFYGLCRNPTRDNPIIKSVVEYAHFYINGDMTDDEKSESSDNDHDNEEEYTFFQSINDPFHVDYNHTGYGLYGMDQQHYISFLNKIKKQYRNEPMIDNWKFVFGKEYPSILITPSLISYYSRIQEMIQKDQYIPLSLIKEFQKIDLIKMKREWQEEVDKINRQTQEFMTKIMRKKELII